MLLNQNIWFVLISCDTCDRWTFYAKVIFCEAEQQNKKQVTNCVVADSTGPMQIVAWEKDPPFFNTKVKVNISAGCSC